MGASAVLLCAGTGLAPPTVGGCPVAVVEDLCDRPGAAAAALRTLDATRVVLGGCGPAEAGLLLAGAAARLERLAPGERGRTALATGALSRRALLALGPALAQRPVAVIDEDACAGTARCGLCVEVCPEHAVAAPGPRPAVDASACTACGACVPRCPHGALRLAGAAAEQVEAQLEELLPGVAGIVFACAAAGADAPPGWALVELPALGLVGPGWLLQVRARGAAVRLAPCDGACCEGARGVEALAARVLEACGTPRPSGGRLRLREPLATADAALRLAPR